MTPNILTSKNYCISLCIQKATKSIAILAVDFFLISLTKNQNISYRKSKYVLRHVVICLKT